MTNPDPRPSFEDLVQELDRHQQPAAALPVAEDLPPLDPSNPLMATLVPDPTMISLHVFNVQDTEGFATQMLTMTIRCPWGTVRIPMERGQAAALAAQMAKAVESMSSITITDRMPSRG